MSVVASDIDGVICDFESAAVKRFGPCDRTLFRLEDRWPDREGEIDVFSNSPYTYLRLDSFRNFAGHLSRMSYACELIFVTSRPPSRAIQEITKWWLSAHGPRRYSRLIFARGQERSKSEIIREFDPVIVYEDNPDEIKQMQKFGLPVIAVDQPWNREIGGARIYEALI